jgi:hypothetical protein
MKPSDLPHRFAVARRWTFLAAALVLSLGFLARAQSTWAQPAGGPTREALRAAVEAKYEVLAGQTGGLVLKPRTEEVGVRTIEVSEDAISVNGEKVSDGVLRAWLGEQADLILRLRSVPAAERPALFDLKSETAGAEEETPPEAAGTDASEEPASSDRSLLPPLPEVPPIPKIPPIRSSSTGGRVNVGSGITVDKDEIVDQAVAVLGSVHVDGEVDENAVAVLGSVVVNGKIGGDVVAVGGNVRLGPKSEVMGDVRSIGGGVYRAEGSRVHGSVQEVGVTGHRHWGSVDVDWGPWGFFSASMDLFWKLIGLVVLALLVFLCLMLGPRQVAAAEHHVAVEPWKAGIVGFLAQLLFLPMLVVVTILLAITIVGCALYLLYPFLFVGLLIGALLGYAAVAHRLGRALENRFDRRFGSPYAVALIGVVAIEFWGLLGRVVDLGGGVLHLLALFILIFAFAAQYAAWTVGIGAMILSRLNRTSPDWEGTVPSPPWSPQPAQPAAPDTPHESPAPSGSADLPLSEGESRPEGEPEDLWQEPPPSGT